MLNLHHKMALKQQQKVFDPSEISTTGNGTLGTLKSITGSIAGSNNDDDFA